ncbi:acyl carrier protein [Thiohalobacter sp. IOR34]|uniref:acyl carrier protein n=1 Tax=Thiohalobacter sp. IOR34 TaxID=3057176 RepID=UPI0025B26A16|nr:acyl carrier protein [Thiohalobacter sp. IOR34]WJW76709.1 acyl carrier protein [Thiohalobacter sp. IOR34]
MNKAEYQEIVALLSDLLEYEGELHVGLSRDDIPKWDSLKHVQIIEALEQEFDVQLSMDEMIEIQGIQDIVNVLERHSAI